MKLECSFSKNWLFDFIIGVTTVAIRIIHLNVTGLGFWYTKNNNKTRTFFYSFFLRKHKNKRQIYEVPIGFPLQVILVWGNLFNETMHNKSLHPPRTRLRYLDDVFAIPEKEKIANFLNAQHWNQHSFHSRYERKSLF